MEFVINNAFYLIIALFIIVTAIMIKLGKKEIVTKAAMIAVEKVAEHFFAMDNREKLNKAVEICYELLPKWIRWFVSKKSIEKMIDEVYLMMKDYIKEKIENNKRTAMDTALGSVTGTIREALELEHNGDRNLVHNEQLKALNLKAEERIDRIYADLKYRTDFKDEKELVASMGFNKSF